MNLIYLHALEFMIYKNKCGRRDRDRMVDGFTTIYAINTNHH